MFSGSKSPTDGQAEAAPTPSRQEITAQCDRIIGSKEFSNALSLQRLLKYLVYESLEGRGGGLKEYSIGLEVFQRSQDFDPRTDAIVRVTVGQLRRRLATYYSSEGAADTVRIQIPKGHYSVEFTLASAVTPETIAARANGLLPGQSELELSRNTRRIWQIAVVILVGILAILGSVGLHLYRVEVARRELPRPVDLRQSLLWTTFLHGENHAIGVVGIASTVVINPVIVRVPNVNDEQSAQSNATIQKLSEVLKAPAVPYNVYTGIGEALAAGRLERAFTESNLDLTLLASQDIRWKDLHAANVIFISSLRFRDLRSALNSTSDFTVEESDGSSLKIINHSPKPGEEAVYQPSGNYKTPSVDYALISIVPGTVPNRYILSVGGTGTLGTIGAVQFITERQSLDELDARLKRDSTTKSHNGLQVLLQVEIVDAQVVSVHYVTHHWVAL